MLKHIVMWKFKEEAEGRTKAENMRIVSERLLALRGVVPQLRAAQMGQDLLQSPASMDLALLAEFDDLEAMKLYRDHPAHQEVAGYIHKVIESRVVIDFEE